MFKVQGRSGSPEALQLRVRQHLGQLEDATDVGHESAIITHETSTEADAIEAAHADREDELRAIDGGEGFELACVLEAGEGGVALECLAQCIEDLDCDTQLTSGEAADNEEAQRVTGC